MALYELDGQAPELPDNGDAWIAPGAHVIGRVRLQEGANVWFGAVLRGDNEWIEIGEKTNVQDMVMMHTDMGYPLQIGKGCTIGHQATLHGCTVGENTLIGMGAVVLNGAKIGKNCVIGAKALVAEGKEIPDNSLVVGVPARVVKTLGEGAARKLVESSEHYHQNAHRFRDGLKEL